MKIETQPRDDHQVRLVVEFEQEQLEKFRHQAARKISQGTRISGFRPGKAPYEVVRRLVGDKAITDQALELLVDDQYPQVIKEAGVHPYTSGTLDEIVKLDPPTLAFLVPLEPKVELGDYRAVRLPYELPQITDEDVDKSIDQMRQGFGTLDTVERPAIPGDMLSIRFHGELTHPIEDEKVDVFEDGPNQVWLRTDEDKAVNNWPFPGFDKEFLGASAGEDKSFVHVFSEDEKTAENLRGREVEFHAHVEQVKAMILPDMDDEFLKKVGNYTDLDGLRADVRKHLEQDAEEDYNDDYYTRLTDQIRETATLEYPPQAVDNETENVLNSIKNDLARQNLDLESYLKIRQMDQATFIEKEIKPAAVKRLERSLIVEAVGKAEDLKLDVDEVTNRVSRTISVMQNSGELKRYRGRMSQDEFTNLLAMDAAAQTMSHQVLERLKSIATGAAEASATETPAELESTVEVESPAPAPETESAPVVEASPAEAEAAPAAPAGVDVAAPAGDEAPSKPEGQD